MDSITVLVSTYNGEKYFEEQLNSILNQKDVNVFVVIRDDGSNDKTLEIAKKYFNSEKMYIIKGKNVGPACSFIDLIKICPFRTNYYAFSDQDDFWRPNKLVRAINMLKESEDNYLYFSNINRVDENRNIIENNVLSNKINTTFYDLIFGYGSMFGCTMVFTSNLFDYIYNYELPNYIVMHDIWVGIIAAYFGKIVYDSNSEIEYRIHNNNYTKKKSKISSLLNKKYSFSKQCCSFFNIYNDVIEAKDKANLYLISSYKKIFFGRSRLTLLYLKKSKENLKHKIKTIIRIYLGVY